MGIEVSIFGLKNKPFRKEDISVNQQFITIKDLIRKIDADYNSAIEKEIINNGLLKDDYVIFKNGYSIDSLNHLETVVRDGDKIFMTILIVGG
jgi:molybdopterin converting factor small subunit